jgi:peptidoglycan/LPS O-acetylase OafA/YrhL
MARPAAVRMPPDSFRPDLEGLRGVAILLVLLFHADLLGVTGGFIGVDVFFVLSGFLITGLLLRERERSGRISLRDFYARRARRILPAAAVVLVATLAAAWFVLAPLDLVSLAGDAVAVALSVGNIHFAINATDYFAAEAPPSPLLHYWSLGVEEQFYLIWPALLIAAMRFGRPRTSAAVALAIVTVVSCLAAVVLTGPAQAWAFFSLGTRAWQLALGGLLAALAVPLARLPRKALAPVGWFGLAGIVAAAFLYDSSMAYPGVAALLPALGAAAVVAAGEGRLSVGRLLATRPLRFLGRISYSLYLVHWPLFVLPAAALAIGETLSLEVRLGLTVVAIVLGWASYRWVEEPIHRGRWLAMPSGRTLRAAGVAIVICVVASLNLGLAAEAQVGSDGPGMAAAAGNGPDAEPSDEGPPIILGDDATLPPQATASAPLPASPSASLSAAGSVGPAPVPTPAPRPGGAFSLPAGVRPALASAAADEDRPTRDACVSAQISVVPRGCVYGDPKGRTTVVLTGDSHAAHWFPAVDRIARASGWRLVVFIKLSCRPMDMATYSYWLRREYTECPIWQKALAKRIQQLKPSLVIVGSVGDGDNARAVDPDPVHQGQAMARTLKTWRSRVAVIVDTPLPHFNVPSCLSGHRADVRACEKPRSIALGVNHGVVERTAASLAGATLVDLTPWVCPWATCPVVLDGMIVYRDTHHLTATFAASLAPAFKAALPTL